VVRHHVAGVLHSLAITSRTDQSRTDRAWHQPRGSRTRLPERSRRGSASVRPRGGARLVRRRDQPVPSWGNPRLSKSCRFDRLSGANYELLLECPWTAATVAMDPGSRSLCSLARGRQARMRTQPPRRATKLVGLQTVAAHPLQPMCADADPFAFARRRELRRRRAKAHGLLTILHGWQSRSRRLSSTHGLQDGAHILRLVRTGDGSFHSRKWPPSP